MVVRSRLFVCFTSINWLLSGFSDLAGRSLSEVVVFGPSLIPFIFVAYFDFFVLELHLKSKQLIANIEYEGFSLWFFFKWKQNCSKKSGKNYIDRKQIQRDANHSASECIN